MKGELSEICNRIYFTDSPYRESEPDIRYMMKHLREGDTVIFPSVFSMCSSRDSVIILSELKNKNVKIKFLKEGLVIGDGNDAMQTLTLHLMLGVREMYEDEDYRAIVE